MSATKNKFIFYLPNHDKSLELISEINNRGLINDYELINIYPKGELTTKVPKQTLDMILQKGKVPALIVPDVNSILVGTKAFNYIKMSTNTNLQTNNSTNSIRQDFMDTFKGEGVNEKELIKISDDYTIIDDEIQVKKNCFNSMDKFEEEIIQLNELDLLSSENQQVYLEKMLQLRKQQDSVILNKDNKQVTQMMPHNVGGNGCKRIINIKRSNQLGSNLMNNKMNDYKFEK